MKIVYGDGCHGHPYCVRRKDQHHVLNLLSEIDWRIDIMHIKGHIGSNCQGGMYDPREDPEMKCINTEVAEQENYWLGGYKHMNMHQDQKSELFLIWLGHWHNVRITERK